MKMSVSVIILTFNEESNLSRCLDSVMGLAEEIIVVDSGSTDRTVEIAKKYGVKVLEHDFKNQADQFNWVLDCSEIKGDWILRLDADEYLTHELREEIANILPGTPPETTGFYLKRRNYFLGGWIKHGGYYPVWILRLFRRGLGRSDDREMDEHILLTKGHANRFEKDFVDDNQNGLSAWVEKHNKYASREAKTFLENINQAARTESDSIYVERQVKKSFYYQLPIFVRPFLYFIYRYFLRMGFLDGKEGLMFHLLQGFWYRFLVDAKIFESEKNKK